MIACGLPERFEAIPFLAMGASAAHSPMPHKTRFSSANGVSALARVKTLLPTVSAIGPGHRFLLGPYLTFLQAYLTRNMVDAMPNIMQNIRGGLDTEGEAPRTQPDIVKE
jgi:hypothetical protein